VGHIGSQRRKTSF